MMRSARFVRAMMWASLFAVCMGQSCDFGLAGRGNSGRPIDDGNPDTALPQFTLIPNDLVLNCDDSDNASRVANWLAGAVAVADEDCGPVTITNDYTRLSNTCSLRRDGWVTEVTWTAEDSCGQRVTTSAQIKIPEPDPPVISLIGEPIVGAESLTGTYVEQGAEATIGCGIEMVPAVTGGDVVDVNRRGLYTVTYDYTDACGRSAQQVTRQVYVAAPPSFIAVPDDQTFDCSDSRNVDQQMAVWLAGAAAVADEYCGEVTITHAIVGMADTCVSEAGTLRVEWTARDECGLTTIASATMVVDRLDRPVVTLNGSDRITLHRGQDTYTEPGAVAYFACGDGFTMPANTIGGDTVDVSTPGTYVVTYQLRDNCGNATAVATRTVEVVD